MITVCPCLESPVITEHRVIETPGKNEAKVSPNIVLTLEQSKKYEKICHLVINMIHVQCPSLGKMEGNGTVLHPNHACAPLSLLSTPLVPIYNYLNVPLRLHSC